MSFTPNGVKINKTRKLSPVFMFLSKVLEITLSILFVISLVGPVIFPNSVQANLGISKRLSYQGRLTDNNGNPLSGTYYSCFSIYDAVSGGTKLWPSGTPTATSTSVSSGVFNIGIGDADTLDFDFSSNDTTYLNIEVSSSNGTCGGAPFEVLAPRQRIDSVAYARYTENLYGGEVRVGTGAGVATSSLKFLKLDVASPAEILGTTCSPNGAVWYNSTNKTALVCNNNVIAAFGSGATSSIYAVKEQSTTTPIVNGTVNFSGLNNITISQTGNTLQFSVPNNVGISAGTQSVSTGTAIFSNSNGISFGMAGSQTITASHNGLTSQSNQAASFTSGSAAFQTLSFTNSNGFSFNSGTQGIFGSYTVPGATVFSNSNNVSFGLNGSTITATATFAGGGGAAISAGTQSVGTGTVNFANSNNISFGMSNSNQITASFNPGVSNLSAGTAAYSGGQVIFSNSNGVSFGMNAGTITASVAAGGGIGAIGITNSSNAFTSGSVMFSGLANITINTSVNGASQYIQLSAPAGGGGGGATVSHWPPFPVGLASSSNYTGATAAGTNITASFHVAPLQFEAAVSFSRINLAGSFATVAGTGSVSLAHMLGIYTLNGGTALSLLSSYMFRNEISQNSTTAITHRWYWGTNSTSNSSGITGNSATNVTGYRMLPLYDVGAGASLSAGQYYIAYAQTNRSSSSNIMPAASIMYISQSQSSLGGQFGSAATRSPFPLIGQFSSTTAVGNFTTPFMPTSINTTVITNTGGSSQWKWPYVNFLGK